MGPPPAGAGPHADTTYLSPAILLAHLEVRQMERMAPMFLFEDASQQLYAAPIWGRVSFFFFALLPLPALHML